MAKAAGRARPALHVDGAGFDPSKAIGGNPLNMPLLLRETLA